MQRRIDLSNEPYLVTVFNHSEKKYLQVGNNTPRIAALSIEEDGFHLIRLGNKQIKIRMAVKGEMTYIRAFGRTFSLRIMDPVEQAAQETGGGNDKARAPMPGTVVSVDVAEGDDVKKGTPMMTIESMKILTVITAPRDGNVVKIHFKMGETFDKNATLFTLTDKEKK